MTRRWARALASAGRSGLRYSPRFSTDPGRYAEAWFGSADPLDTAPAAPHVGDDWRDQFRVVPATYSIRKETIHP